MTSIKLKFRPSTTPGKEGSIVFQLIYGRAVRRITSEYKIFAEEWDDEEDSSAHAVLVTLRPPCFGRICPTVGTEQATADGAGKRKGNRHTKP